MDYESIDIYRQRWQEGKVRISAHALKRLLEREISLNDVENCILLGEIIESYPNNYPSPSVLIFGFNMTGKVIHVVCGCSSHYIHLITAYYPTELVFMEDLKTRRNK